MNIGVMIPLGPDTDILREFQKAAELELTCCQVCCWDTSLYTDENAQALRQSAKATGVVISGLWAGWCGPKQWNFTQGPATLGLVPAAYRHARMQDLLAASAFAQRIETSDLITHVGFLPENPYDPVFHDVVAALSHLCGILKQRGQFFLFETGQETPVTLLRAIEAIGTGNLGVNLDTANLILYGKGNTVDALDVLGKYIRNTHCKDGLYPTEGTQLGTEVPFGMGKANFPELIRRLIEVGYAGPLIIEREIHGPKQVQDIILARDGLRQILSSIKEASI